jgi:hypothetical protein
MMSGLLEGKNESYFFYADFEQMRLVSDWSHWILRLEKMFQVGQLMLDN